MNAYELGVKLAMVDSGLIKTAIDGDELRAQILSTLADIGIGGTLGAGVGGAYGAVADGETAGKSSLRGLITGAGAGTGANIAHRLSFEPSFMEWFLTGKPGVINYPAIAGGAAAGGLGSYLLSRQLVE